MTIIAHIPEDKPWKFVTNDDGQVIIPDNMVDLQNFLETLWNRIFENNEQEQIKLYNQAAVKYNKAVGFQAITIIDNFKKQKQIMATKKAAAEKKAATKKATAKKVAVKAVSKKAVPKKAEPKKDGKKKVSQKVIVAELADKGLTIDQIVEQTGIKKTNVSWYFSKLKLGKKK